jgi:peptide/nickel transport system permease protein
MVGFALRRTFSAVLVLVAISMTTFAIFQLMPNGDPAQRMAGRTATPQTIAAIRHDWGFDQPVYVQYAKTMGKVLTGHVVSYTQQVNVVEQIERGLPATLSLCIGAALIWLALGVLFGLASAIRAGGFTDRVLTVLALAGISAPVFLVGGLMLYFLAFQVPLFPKGGYVPLTQDPVAWLHHMILPWSALAVLFVGVYSRVLRSEVLDTLNEDFVRTARAKGLSERRVLFHHVLRNSMIGVVSLWGLDFAALVGGGAIITESVFNLHGVGQYAAQSIGQLDVPPVLVITMFGAFFVVLFSALTDIVYAWLDPRIRVAG